MKLCILVHRPSGGQINAETQSGCSSECCSMQLDKPFHPIISFNNTKRLQGKQARTFCGRWFNEHKWLTFCVSKNVVFCFYCRLAVTKGLLTFNKRSETTFASKGFNNWKKAKAKFREHEQSKLHTEAYTTYRALQQPSVASQLSLQAHREQEAHRELLMKLLSSLQYLLRQGLAIRGHIEEESNLFQLLKCRSEDIPALLEWLSDGRYRSPTIVNELIQVMAFQLLRGLLEDIRGAGWYSIIADETRDISGKEQLAVLIRWVDASYNVNEDLIGFVEVCETDASTLTSAIKDVLLRVSLPLSQCVGQAYDGASNMAGHLSGVAKRIQDEEPRALFVHCMAHCLNLCLQECAFSCHCVREALALTSELASLIRASPKRLGLFERIQNDLAPNSPGLKPLCPTRWTVRTAALNAVIKNYTVISCELETIGKEAYGEPSTKSCGLLAMMDKFAVYFGLKLSHMIFSVSEQLSITLQRKDINAQEAIKAVTQAKSFFRRHRSDSAFNDFFQATSKEAEDLTQPPTLPRQRHVPRRIDDGAQAHQFTTVEEYFHKQYFEVLDLLSGELDNRFQQPSFKFLEEMECLLIKSCNGQHVKPSEEFCSMYGKDLQMDRLLSQLNMLPDLVRTVSDQQQYGIKSVTSIRTILDLMNANSFSKTFLSEVDRLLRMYLTVPMTSATAERTFSTLRRLKSYLRSTMSQKRLNHVILLHTHKERVDALDLLTIAKEFVSANDRRRSYFGHF